MHLDESIQEEQVFARTFLNTLKLSITSNKFATLFLHLNAIFDVGNDFQNLFHHPYLTDPILDQISADNLYPKSDFTNKVRCYMEFLCL